MNFQATQNRMGRGILRDDLSSYYGDYINDALVDIQNRHDWPCMKMTTQVTIPAGTGEQSVTLPGNWKELQGIYFITPDGQYIPGRLDFESGQIREQWHIRSFVLFQLPWSPPFSLFYERYGYAPPVDVTSAGGNLVPSGAEYDVNGQFVLGGLVPGFTYNLTLGGNDSSVTNGTATLTGTTAQTFVAQQDFLTLTGTGAGASVTASVSNTIVPAAGVTAVLGVVGQTDEPYSVRVDYWGYLPKLVNATDTNPLLSAYPEMVIAKAKAIAFETINDEEAYGFNTSLYEKQLDTAIRQDAYSNVAGRVTRM